MSWIVTTEKKIVTDLMTLARGKSNYNNNYPYNLLYWNGERFLADCVNLYKALFNGRDITNKTAGSYQSNLSNTGDCTEWGMMAQCSDRSSDFTKLGNQLRCLYMDGHFGGYLGFEWNEPGQGIVNCVESTPAWEDGIQFSYVDSAGRRLWYKGGPQRSAWTVHGKPDAFVDYSVPYTQTTATDVQETAKEEFNMNTTENVKILVSMLPDIKYGTNNETVKVLQTILKKYGWYADTIDGNAGPNTVNGIKLMQTALGVTVDGWVGQQTWTKLLIG